MKRYWGKNAVAIRCKSFLAVASVDIRFYCMYSILYSAGLRINELLSLKPDDIDVSRSLIHVRQGKGKKDRYTLLSKPLVGKLSEYRERYNPETWLFERETGVFRKYRVEKVERNCSRSRNNKTGVPAPVSTFVRYPPDRARNGFKNRSRAIGT